MIIHYEKEEVLEMLESTLLRPDITLEKIDALCNDALQYNFAAVVVNPRHVRRCARNLRNSKVKIATVIGYPLGEDVLPIKLKQIKTAVKDGATDLDVMSSISLVKQGAWKEWDYEIFKIVKAAKGRIVKVILETCFLGRDEIIKCCEICVKNKVRYIQTSSGFGTEGATLDDISLITKAVKDAPRTFHAEMFPITVKAAGGIKTLKQAKELAEAGAMRIGTSSALIMTGEKVDT